MRAIIEMTPAAEATIKDTAFGCGRAEGAVSKEYKGPHHSRFAGEDGYAICAALFGHDVAYDLWHVNWEAGRQKGLREAQRTRAKARRAPQSAA